MPRVEYAVASAEQVVLAATAATGGFGSDSSNSSGNGDNSDNHLYLATCRCC
jgi:hypothetical protein